MRSKYSNIIAVLVAILAFIPLLTVNYLFDSYVRQDRAAQMQRAADYLTAEIGSGTDDAIRALENIVAESPSLCTPTFLANVHRAMTTSLHVRQVVVENRFGDQFCDAYGGQVRYSALSDDLSIAGHSETVAVVKIAGLNMPLLKVTELSGERLVSAFVPLLTYSSEDLLHRIRPARFIDISLANGANVLSIGQPGAADSDVVSAQSFAGETPLRAQIGAPFSMLRADFAGTGIILTLLAGALSATLILLTLRYMRRPALSAFELERAIIHGDVKPYYQPVIDLGTGRLIGCEVLARWEKRNGELVPPGAFIDSAEQSGLAIPMTVSLMQQVRADLSELCRQQPTLKISINLFEGHFRDSSIADDVLAIFGGSPISFRQLVFEITERRPLSNDAQTHEVIAKLHALGTRLAMDDVGTGHSNLAYLQTLGVDIIKIDRIFVDMIKPDTATVPVLDGLISLARDLGTEVIAEGVETEAQALYLRGHGVFMAQGFLFAPALKPKAFKELALALNEPFGTADEPFPNAA
ncbi:MAG TPA: EAL domain-containing protein [Devosiaceae bacterium]|nr:EAL domain-containing protein [Devosiaceae bacterium]